MTGFPIIETKGNDISAYIPTNVISITDGQIFLETGLFNSGVRPAINVGVSVSRVGGNAQLRAMRTVAGSLRLNLAQYRELEAFSAFGSDLDKASQDQLARGARLVELLKQPQYSPYPVEHEVVSIWAGTTGELDIVPVADIRRFEREFLDYVGREHRGIYDAILQTGKLEDDTVEALKRGGRRVQAGVRDLGGRARWSTRRRPRRWTPSEVGQETVKRYRHRARQSRGLTRWPDVFASSAAGSARSPRPSRSPRRWSWSPPPASPRRSSGSRPRCRTPTS